DALETEDARRLEDVERARRIRAERLGLGEDPGCGDRAEMHHRLRAGEHFGRLPEVAQVDELRSGDELGRWHEVDGVDLVAVVEEVAHDDAPRSPTPAGDDDPAQARERSSSS